MTQAKVKIKKGDQVVLLTGRDKGKKGEVMNVNLLTRRVTVQGVNQVKKHRKPTQSTPGGIDTISLSMDVSNVSLLDPKTGKATRVGYKNLKDGTKVRIAKKSGETID